ncbi:MAG: 30S ribosomal protein S5 [Cyanobacteria bacterium]|nr:30S ribosomal protein S5 [Cyanobacteriota bacterium]
MDKRPQRNKSSQGGAPANPGATKDDKSPNAMQQSMREAVTAVTARGEDSEWKEKVIQIRRVTKVVKGGKKLSFRAVVVVGNNAGQVGLGIGKSNEVIGAIQKGVSAAKKALITVPIHSKTIPHPVQGIGGASKVVMRPASEGTGVIAGGAVRAVLELAGIENILSKSLGSNSPLNVARATINGLADLRNYRAIAKNRGMTVHEMLN